MKITCVASVTITYMHTHVGAVMSAVEDGNVVIVEGNNWAPDRVIMTRKALNELVRLAKEATRDKDKHRTPVR